MKAISYRQRIGLLALFCGCGLFLLVCRLAALQVFQHQEWLQLADRLRSGWRPVRALRGEIVDREGRVLAQDAASFELAVLATAWLGLRHECGYCGAEHFAVRYTLTDGVKVFSRPRRCRRCRETGEELVKPADERNLAPIARMLGMRPADLTARIEARVKRVERHVEHLLGDLTGKRRARVRRELWRDHGRRPLLIQGDVPYEVAREVALNRRRNPAFLIRNSHGRVYPGGGIFAHILGRLSPLEKNEPRFIVERADGTSRSLSTERGRSGIEYHFEADLRGSPGWVEIERDPRSRARSILDERLAEPGRRVWLTIDSEVQRRAASALGDVKGAFVVINANTGAAIALVTSPRYEPEAYFAAWKRWTEHVKGLGGRRAAGSPFVERAFRSYQIPGSIMKPFTGLAALESGDGAHDEIILCERGFWYHGRVIKPLRCNQQHNELDMHGALKHSCNVYFQTLVGRMVDGRRFDTFVEMGRRFGFGQRTGIEINGQDYFGRWKFDGAKQTGTLIAAAIGQGWVETSPAQIARAYAGLATGYLPRLHLVARVGDSVTRPERTSLGLPAERIERIREALREVPRPGGSAYTHAGELARHRIACKTGTAQRGKSGYNAWMAGFAPARAGRPPIAFAMVVLRTDLGGGATCGPRLAEFFQYFYSGGKQ